MTISSIVLVGHWLTTFFFFTHRAVVKARKAFFSER